MTALLLLAALLVAAANGANDNFKGVATLYGSGTAGYRGSLWWGSLTVLGGGLASTWLAPGLLAAFTGKGLVPDVVVGTPAFAAAVGGGAALTVAVAAWRGLPISTTHALIGAMCGAGLIAGNLHLTTLGGSFLLPLLASPLLALLPAAGLGRLFSPLVRLVVRPACVCVETPLQLGTSGTALLRDAHTLRLDDAAACARDAAQPLLRLDAARVVDALHWLLAGAAGFARGLNDTPKIAALLLGLGAFGVGPAVTLVAAAMLAGGLAGARRVAHTLSHRITRLELAPALAGSLTTSLLVTTASFSGLPVSTTHVAVGALTGAGLGGGQPVDRGVLRGIVTAWVLTLPAGALFGALLYLWMT